MSRHANNSEGGLRRARELVRDAIEQLLPEQPLPEASPAAIAIQAFGVAEATYARITQIGDAAAFVCLQFAGMLSDPDVSGEAQGLKLIEEGQKLPKERPLPNVVWAVFVSCAYAAEAIHSQAQGDGRRALLAASRAQYFAGFGDGAARELVSKFDFRHSPERVVFANLGKAKNVKEQEAKLKTWAQRPKYARMSKEQAGLAMDEDGFGLSSHRIERALGRLFPGKSWKSRRIDRSDVAGN